MLNKADHTRRHDIDWLRVLAVLLLIPFHSCLIFVLCPDSIMYIKDTVNSVFLDRVAGFIHQFHMPLMFVLGGASSWYALKRRSGQQYLRERCNRLLVPALFGMVVLVPPMTFITRIARGEAISFGNHFVNFFKLNPNDLAGYYGTLTPAHLWFIIFLFVFSLVGLPLLQWLRQSRSQAMLGRLAGFFEHRFALYLIVVPLALAAAPDILGDKNPLVYFLTFFLGFLLMTDERYQKAIDRDTPITLVVAIALEVFRQTWSVRYPEWSFSWVTVEMMLILNRWAWVLAILGLGHRFFKSGGPILQYLSEAAFPFYVLHMLLNTLVGYWVIGLQLSVAVKYLLIVALATVLTFAAYEVIKRIRPLRFALGIKEPARVEASRQGYARQHLE